MHYDAFLRQVCPSLDMNWRKYRRRAARHRLHARMQELRLTSYEQYLQFLADNPREAAELPDRMRITVSRFFRERPQWDIAGQLILPALLESIKHQKKLRIWSVGCCGGEEPYTIALLWLACLQTINPEFKIEILATDIDDASLARAEKATYAQRTLRETPEFIFHAYFEKTVHQWRLAREVRDMVTFKKHNFMNDPLPQNVDFICCRYYVFTYYTGTRMQQAAARLHNALKEHGVLMIGRRESITKDSPHFASWNQQDCFYRPKPIEL